MLHIALHQPQIPPNTGNIIRLCANCGYELHLIEPLGFVLEDKALRRAGLDYHEFANVSVWATFNEYLAKNEERRIVAVETSGKTPYSEIQYTPSHTLLFGSETLGLPGSILKEMPEDCIVRLPMKPSSRSLNLSNSVAVVAYHAWYQMGFLGSGA